MQLSSRSRALFVVVFIASLIYIYTWLLYPSLPLRKLLSVEVQQPVEPQQPLSKDDFISEATRIALGYYNSTPLENFCAHDSWDAHKVINCDRIFGGIGNMRQRVIACTRHAMKEGLGFIVPSISQRNNEDLSLLESDGFTTFDYVFDRDLFISRLAAACPRMIILDSLQAAEEKGLEIFHFPATMAQFFICEDPFDLAINLGHLLPFPPLIYRLAYTALYALSIEHQLFISPTPISSSSVYLGVHLRTATDAVAMGWSDFETQSNRYLHLATNLTVPVIYVASGNATSVALFTKEAAALSPPVMVVTKNDLLSGSDLIEMQALTWDQVALIDYVLLESSGFFAGMTESSFSWNVAIKRAAVAGVPNAVCGDDVDVGPDVVWKDRLSEIYGEDSTAFRGRIWP